MDSKALPVFLRSICVAILCILYYWIGYRLDRSSFWLLFSLYTTAFAASYYLMQSDIKLNYLIGLSFGLKLIFLLAIPELSQDFYRFIWDGMLMVKGYNPYLHLPVELMTTTEFKSESFSVLLYNKMGELSANNYSNYPPVAQFVYAFCWRIAGENLLLNIVLLRCFNLIAELGILIYSLKILKKINLPKRQILIFILNPLVIIESTGNLHFEVMMIAFFIFVLYQLSKNKFKTAAVFWSLSALSKLMTLMFLPLLWAFFRKQKTSFMKSIQTALSFYILVGLCFAGAYFIFWDKAFLGNYQSSLRLYFNNFEFNASIYYVLRWIGFQYVGYNLIAVFGKALAITAFLVILWLSFREKKIDLKKLFVNMLLAITGYYLLSTTVHPWYLLLPLVLSVFTTYKYMLIWSYLVILSYAAYQTDTVNEKNLLITLQYAIVIISLNLEIFYPKSLNRS
jgi:hypothetical protein